MIEAKLYATLRAMADGQKAVSVEGESHTVGSALDHLVARYPALSDGIFDELGRVRSFVAVMVNGRDIRHLDGLKTEVAPGSTLDIFPPVAGGALGGR